MLTLIYLTNRKTPQFHWFIDSLKRQLNGDPMPRIVLIDYYAGERTFEGTTVHVKPKPSVWQGEHRLTKKDYFAASNARNTGLCLAPDGWIAYVDDLSVLVDGWYNALKEAMAGNYIVCGSYRKVKKLEVREGYPIGFEEFSDDNRLRLVKQDVTPCAGNWLYGCSVAGPVEAFLTVNGWPEDLCDGMGFEDCCMGLVLKNAGFDLRYDRRMMTLESEEGHHGEGATFSKSDYHFENGVVKEGGNGKDDKSHACLNIALASKYFPNSFNIRELRAKVLAGEPFPIMENPRNEWYTKLPLNEL